MALKFPAVWLVPGLTSLQLGLPLSEAADGSHATLYNTGCVMDIKLNVRNRLLTRLGYVLYEFLSLTFKIVVPPVSALLLVLLMLHTLPLSRYPPSVLALKQMAVRLVDAPRPAVLRISHLTGRLGCRVYTLLITLACKNS